MTHRTPAYHGARKPKIMAIVLAGGEGSRLRPLTMTHATPALPFATSYRLIDFTLSNLVNSGIDTIYVLAQYKPKSLIAHIEANWATGGVEAEQRVRVVLPQHEYGGIFDGPLDAVAQNLELIERHEPDLVAVFAADQVFRMDVRQMVQYHYDCGADATLAVTQMPIAKASAFGVVATGHDGEIRDFQERPDAPCPLPFNPSFACASMGNYLFNADVLAEELERALYCGETDFGRHLMPRLIHSRHVYAYDFASNVVPGGQPYEEPAYWRHIGTLEAYIEAHQDVAGKEPRLNLQNPYWPQLPALVERNGVPSELRVADEVFPAQYAAMQAGHA